MGFKKKKKRKKEIGINVKIVDAIMGAGKTSAAIDYINNSGDSVRFLYITPLISEVERVIESCPSKHFVQPKEMGTKLQGIKKLFSDGVNIASTHALFNKFDEEVIELAYNNGYVLIMDEVADVVTALDITQDDAKTLLEKYVTVEDNGLLTWTADTYQGKFEEYKRLCDLGSVALYGGELLLWMFPIKVFEAFFDIYILTYMFNAQIQRYYYDFYGLEYEYIYVTHKNNRYRFTEVECDKYICDYSNLIKICDDNRLNRIGDKRTDLSKSWYTKNSNTEVMTQLKNNIYTYFKRRMSSSSQDIMWTTFNQYKKILSVKGCSKGFIPCNTRATNNYRSKTVLCYTVNRFLLPAIKNFFVANGVEVDEDGFALSEMLQWIWRSAIRENKEVYIYIPSARMRGLLIQWMEDIKNDAGN